MPFWKLTAFTTESSHCHFTIIINCQNGITPICALHIHNYHYQVAAQIGVMPFWKLIAIDDGSCFSADGKDFMEKVGDH